MPQKPRDEAREPWPDSAIPIPAPRRRSPKVPAWTIVPATLLAAAVAFAWGTQALTIRQEVAAAVRQARAQAFIAGWREAKLSDWTSTRGADVLYQDSDLWLYAAGVDVHRECPNLELRLQMSARLWRQEQQP